MNKAMKYLGTISLLSICCLCCQLAWSYELKFVNETSYAVEAKFVLLIAEDHVQTVDPRSTVIYRPGILVSRGLSVIIPVFGEFSRIYDTGPENIMLEEIWGPLSSKLGSHTWVLREERNKSGRAIRFILTRESKHGKQEYKSISEWINL
jgi:hypothetical protein